MIPLPQKLVTKHGERLLFLALKIALVVTGIVAGSSFVVAAEVRPVDGGAPLIDLQGCWMIDTHSSEGGYYRMCFAPDGRVSLTSYNALQREAFVENSRYWLQDDKLNIAPVSVELWPFHSAHVACDARIRPRLELQLSDCDAAGVEPGGLDGAFGGQPWNYDGEATDG